MQVFDIGIDDTKKEITAHGSYAFPMVIYENQLNRNILGFVKWHWHEELQFCLVKEGEVRFKLNAQSFILDVGEGIFINSGCIHMAEPIVKPESSYLCLNFNPKMVFGFHGSDIESKYVNPLVKASGINAIVLKQEIAWEKFVLDTFKVINKIYEEKNFGFELDTQSALLRIMLELFRNVNINTCSSILEERNNERLKAILKYIHENYNVDCSLDKISHTACLSKSACCKLFKRCTNMTLSEYILTYRIHKGKELLCNTRASISQIADSVGFGSASYFIEKFKSQTTCTPKEFRNSIAKTACISG